MDSEVDNWKLFFLGGDCAPADTHRSDDGALVASMAEPKALPNPGQALSNNFHDWWFTPVYARTITSRERATTRQWSGLVHDLHRRFSFTKICFDPNQGGVYVSRDMRQTTQLINGVEQECRPIGDQVIAPTMLSSAEFILHLFKRGDPGVEAIWPKLAGDDQLKAAMYGETKNMLDFNAARYVTKWNDLRNEQPELTNSWSEEQIWASKNLMALCTQLVNIHVLKNANGQFAFTGRGAHTFKSAGKDDLALAYMYSFMAFRMFLALGNFRPRSNEDKSACMVF